VTLRVRALAEEAQHICHGALQQHEQVLFYVLKSTCSSWLRCSTAGSLSFHSQRSNRGVFDGLVCFVVSSIHGEVPVHGGCGAALQVRCELSQPKEMPVSSYLCRMRTGFCLQELYRT
jgi:hypothetical protein